MNERLREARFAAGYESAAAAARRLGVPYGTYSGHENGQRGIRTEDLAAYAKAFKTTVSWLAFGDENAQETISIPVRGIVHDYASLVTMQRSLRLADALKAGDEIARVISSILEVEQIALDFAVPSDVIAFRVFGNLMLPHFRDGDCFLVREKPVSELDAHSSEDLFIRIGDFDVYYVHELLKIDLTYVAVHHNAQSTLVEQPKGIFEIIAVVGAAQIRRTGTALADEYRAADRRGAELRSTMG